MTEKSLIFGVLLFLKLQVCCSYTQHTLPDIENSQFMEECVRMHNRFRSSVDPPASNMKRMMVWAETYKVGCAVHFCPIVQGFNEPNAAHFICDYGPSGNYPTWPYKSGVPCSECHGEPCLHRLCGEVWVAPYCDTYCIIVLVLRTSSFLITFVTVFFLKQHYPRMYMYK